MLWILLLMLVVVLVVLVVAHAKRPEARAAIEDTWLPACMVSVAIIMVILIKQNA